MNRTEEALALFKEGFNCSQGVLSVFDDVLSIDRELALKVATGFGGGIRNGELCGAVSGAVMMIGLKNGHFTIDDLESKANSYRMTKLFTDRFREIHGEIVCKKLLGYDLSKPDHYRILDENGAFGTECPKYIASAIEILESMLSDGSL